MHWCRALTNECKENYVTQKCYEMWLAQEMGAQTTSFF